MRLLYERRGELKGIALVNGLKALATLAEKEELSSVVVEDDTSRSILDRIDALPIDHGRKLLIREVDRLEHELGLCKAKLEEIGDGA